MDTITITRRGENDSTIGIDSNTGIGADEIMTLMVQSALTIADDAGFSVAEGKAIVARILENAEKVED